MRVPEKLPPAIVLSGQTAALGVVRALGIMGVPVIVLRYDSRDTAHLSKYCTYHIAVPHPEKSEDEFIGVLMKCASRFGGGVLFPGTDETLAALARHKDLLHRHYIVGCPGWETVRQCIDKQYTSALAEASGVPAPKTVVLSSLGEAEESRKRIEFPCLVKPCQSHLFYEHFRHKMFPVANFEEMMLLYREAAGAGLEVMLQEIIPGTDADVVNYNAYFHEGKPALEFTAQHVRNAPPSWGSPRVAVSKDIPEVIGPGRKLLQALGFEGYSCTEFKKDARDGVYKLMEVNARHNLSTLLAVRCGVNFPWLHYRHLVYGESPSPLLFAAGIYWIDVTRDAGYSLGYLASEHYSPRQYISPYLCPRVFAILDVRDLKPFIKRCTFLALEGLRSLCGLFRESHLKVCRVKKRFSLQVQRRPTTVRDCSGHHQNQPQAR